MATSQPQRGHERRTGTRRDCQGGRLSYEYALTFWEDFQTAPVRILDAPNSLILEAAEWKSRHRISYADAFALATAAREQAPLVSGDPEFQTFLHGGPIQIEWIGVP